MASDYFRLYCFVSLIWKRENCPPIHKDKWNQMSENLKCLIYKSIIQYCVDPLHKQLQLQFF